METIPNAMSTIIEPFVNVPTDSKENPILSVLDILVKKMTIVKQTKNVVQTKYVEIHVWSKVLVDQMHNAELQIEWLIVLVHLVIMEMPNSNASQERQISVHRTRADRTAGAKTLRGVTSVFVLRGVRVIRANDVCVNKLNSGRTRVKTLFAENTRSASR